MTTKKTLKVLLLCVVVALIAYALGTNLFRIWRVREGIRAKLSETHMRELMSELDTLQPSWVDTAHLRSLLAKEGRAHWLDDGWGRPLVVEHTFKDGRARYKITSLGRDGRRGPCCKKWVYNWDDDAVLSGDEWLQVWYTLSMPGDGRTSW